MKSDFRLRIYDKVALRKESVDRNSSLGLTYTVSGESRSPQGERG